MTGLNVLLLLSDEHQYQAIGAIGHPLIHTPNLDRLRARGTLFSDAYSPSPICVPARAALATGRWCHQTGHWDNALAYNGSPPSWAHQVRANGNAVASIGKLHYVSSDDDNGWTEELIPAHIEGGIGQVHGSVRDPLPDSSAVQPSLFKPYGAGHSSYNKFDEAVVDRAVRWLNDHAADAEPWVLQVGFVAPHFPLIVPNKFLERYSIEDIPLPRLRGAADRTHPWVERQHLHTNHDAVFDDEDDVRGAVRVYYALVSFLDHQIGKVLDALDRAGLADDTLVIYTTDHGEQLGERGLWGKCQLYNESTRVPMLISGPDVGAGAVNRTPVNLVDLHPTICEAVGAPSAPGVVGQPIQNFLGAEALERVQFSEYHAIGSPSAGYLLRSGSWAYHHYVGYEPELFDLADDPTQTVSVAHRHPDIVARLRAELEQFVDPESTDRRAKADQNALVERHGGRNKALITGTRGATEVGVE